MNCWPLGPRFPAWLQSQKDLRILDLSNASISDVIPSWFWSQLSQIQILDLSQNHIRGSISKIFSSMAIYLGSNNFSGPLPRFSHTILQLDLSDNSFSGSLSPIFCEHEDSKRSLSFLDLSRNLFSEELLDCWTGYTNLIVLQLGNNNLSSNIPSSLGSLSNLQSLVLNRNNLSGNLPLSLQDCKKPKIVDLSENHFFGGLSIWMGNSLVDLVVLQLRSNKFSGGIPQQHCNLCFIQDLDLAQNNLSRSIPGCFSNFGGMRRQQRSTQIITFSPEGKFPETVTLVINRIAYEYSNAQLALSSTLDLSSNNFIGEMPEY
ncbi:receptor-like protein EIX2 [Juglans microcarpa x Juglans regia]|uniref:receptor-like protein EIX2 n=1 Tax=Juglans microcarpa x Juglans regia TaxID=2249226 RepID=UPI001B7F53F5|nr:receptor-like protein EIX2 [Juglans microcarpa x Juglans regia]